MKGQARESFSLALGLSPFALKNLWRNVEIRRLWCRKNWHGSFSLNEYLDIFWRLSNRALPNKPLDSYGQMLRVHIRPKAGKLKLSDIKILTVQKVYSEMQQKRLSPRTVRYAHSGFSMSLKKAIELGYIINSSCSYAELPRQDEKEIKPFHPNKQTGFSNVRKTRNHTLEPNT